ncbi:MAG: hypothetical protein AMJ61_00455 [Desulfobacterales bacterium SG8_35_2]|nr:MAG: hypothetical protein AMJ61_00455 [Desulfobacterales bacterium SG8_35_2]
MKKLSNNFRYDAFEIFHYYPADISNIPQEYQEDVKISIFWKVKLMEITIFELEFILVIKMNS